MAKCQGCGEEIAFVPLRSGKKMPVESAEPEEYHLWTELPRPAPPGTVFDRINLVVDGQVVSFWQGVRVEEDGRVVALDGPCTVLGYESHFASCPKAREFRR